MAKLYFRYGTMFAAKSANLLDVKENYFHQGKPTLLAKPSFDTRDGATIVASRVRHIQEEADYVIRPGEDNFREWAKRPNLACVLIDEAQFLSEANVVGIEDFVLWADIPAICYGLRSDWKRELFPGSAALLARADSIEEVKTVCSHACCNRKALFNRRDHSIAPTGPAESQEVGHHFLPVCRQHFQ